MGSAVLSPKRLQPSVYDGAWTSRAAWRSVQGSRREGHRVVM